MQLSRPSPPRRLISLVSMIDVLLIMLVFFMVTSTFLDLDMIPVAKSAETPGAATDTTDQTPLMIRLGADGQAFLRGRPLDPGQLAASIGTRRSVLILPSPQADTQSLVSLMDGLTRAGIVRLRIVQLAGQP